MLFNKRLCQTRNFRQCLFNLFFLIGLCFVSSFLAQCSDDSAQVFQPQILENVDVVTFSETPEETPFLTSSSYYGDGLNLSIAGSGSHVSFAVHPIDQHRHCVGTDLNGIFCTQDAGVTYRNVSLGLRTRHVRSIAFDPVDSDTIYLGTNDGVYKTTDFGVSWSLKNSGFLSSAGRVSYPVSVVKVDPQNSNVLWAGFGGGEISNIQYDNTLILAEGCHPYALYKSTDAGETWVPQFSLMPEFTPERLGSEGVSSSDCPVLNGQSSGAPETVSFVVNNLAIRSSANCDATQGCQEVCAATDVGLYCTYDGGERFYEVGVRNVRFSDNQGVSWRNCHQHANQCRAEFVTSTTCNGSADCAVCTKNYSLEETELCLPLNSESEVAETHPHVLDVEFAGNDKLYITLFEAGYVARENRTPSLDCRYSNGDIAYDENLDLYQGGLYLSENSGASFQNLSLGDNGSTVASLLRCHPSDRIGLTNNYSFLSVDENDPEHVFIGGMNVYHNLFKGVYERYRLTNGGYGWRGINRGVSVEDPERQEICYEREKTAGSEESNFTTHNCYEGNAAEGLYGGTSTNVRFLESLAAQSSTSVFFGHQRGFHQAIWDVSASHYEIDFLNGNPESASSILWQGQVDNACPYQVYEFDESSLLVIMADAGVALSPDASSWEILRNINNYGDWSLEDFYMDDMRASVRDKDTLEVYAHASYRKDPNSNSVLKSTRSDYRDWEHIGGCYLDSESMNCTEATDYGLPSDVVIESLGVVYNTGSADRKLIAGTDGDGFYVYDPTLSERRRWDRATRGTCGILSGATITDIYTDPEHPNWALVAAHGNSQLNYNKDGIYLLDFSHSNSIDCEKLLNATSPRCVQNSDGIYESCDPFNPTEVEVTKNTQTNTYRIVVAGNHPAKPYNSVLFTTAFDLDDLESQLGSYRIRLSLDWQISLDFAKTFSGRYYSQAGENWWSYLESLPAEKSHWQEEYTRTYFYNKSWSTLTASPTNPKVVLAGMYAPTNFSQNNPEHIYVSQDGGRTFEVAEIFEELPFKSVQQITFSDDGQWIYVLGSCTSMYRFPNPY